MRGKDTFRYKLLVLPRITPAYAGKSAEGTVARAPYRDHPCVCGEKECE